MTEGPYQPNSHLAETGEYWPYSEYFQVFPIINLPILINLTNSFQINLFLIIYEIVLY